MAAFCKNQSFEFFMDTCKSVAHGFTGVLDSLCPNLYFYLSSYCKWMTVFLMEEALYIKRDLHSIYYWFLKVWPLYFLKSWVNLAWKRIALGNGISIFKSNVTKETRIKWPMILTYGSWETAWFDKRKKETIFSIQREERGGRREQEKRN